MDIRMEAAGDTRGGLSQEFVDSILQPEPKDDDYLMITRVDDYSVRENAAIQSGAAPVPEPATLTVLGIGAATAFLRKRFRRRV
ncbi:MAG: PEP-CTERM sorting domain-containing protein [Armatimonadetes bacterium]|nr:PEP-CTERM sorting domain-containing protein [Armatimonadota bacterium]NOG92631.1 PEP-CTERM sorting domain-containing protein [Armatimonadota bacterium]